MTPLLADENATKARLAGFEVREIFPAEGGDPAVMDVAQGKNLRDVQRYKVRWTPTPDGGFDVVFVKPAADGGETYTVAVLPSGRARGCNCEARTDRCRHVRAAEHIAAGEVVREG